MTKFLAAVVGVCLAAALAGVSPAAAVARDASSRDFFLTSAQAKRHTLASSAAAAAEGPRVARRFRKVTLAAPLADPMELDVAPDGRVFFIERSGRLRVYDQNGDTSTLATIDVDTSGEHGLLGLALDPRFEANGRIYMAYSRGVGTGVEIRLSRFTLDGAAVDSSSEEVLLSFITLGGCCHEAGSLAFGPDGNLYFSTGDDTNGFASQGYAPIDERLGRARWDAQKSASNTMDLRGKILRITPQDAGGYAVPAGNLFPGGIGGRPEIYVMGLRNPFRFAFDSETGSLYFGDVGPDAPQADPSRGPRGYDEINRAHEAGNYGWPYCIADNEPYVDYDFETEVSGAQFDCAAPQNDSPNNTGSLALPPAKGALIWYPYASSPDFPELGSGGRTALAGPVYHRGSYARSTRRLPASYEGSLFMYDFIRGWIKAVRFNRENEPRRIDPFAPDLDFRRPIDMTVGPDGALYILEWGRRSGGQNDSGLYRVEPRRRP